MAVADKIRRLKSSVQIIEAGPGCVGFWIDSQDRVKYANDQGEVFILHSPASEDIRQGGIRMSGVFASSNTLSLTFEREISIILAGNTITFAEGDLTAADVGKEISWTGFSGLIVSLDTATTATVSASAIDGAFTATVGTDMDDTLYRVVAIVGEDVLEIFGCGNKSASGFDVYSSNPTSTAEVIVTVVR